MNFRSFSRLFVGILILTFAIVPASVATPVVVGTGNNSAGVYIEWKDDFAAEFEIKFGQDESDTITGADMMLTFDSEVADFNLGYTDWGSEEPDLFVDSIEYLGHFNGGFGGGADWWHYWIKDAGEVVWVAPLYGMSSRIVHNGDMDCWIYGRNTALPEPATLTVLLLGTALLRKKRV